jgi:drug/metabolite transporter (DMT)-like permease
VPRALLDRPYLLLTLTALSWGANAVAGRLAVGLVSPMALICLRWLVVVVVLGMFARREIAAAWPVLAPRWRTVVVMGTLGFTAFNAFLYLSAHHTTAVNIGVIQGVTPAFVLLGGLLAYRTPVRALQVAGLVLTLIGVMVVASRGEIGVLSGLAFNMGDLGMVVASALYAGYTVALRKRPPVAPLAFFAALAGVALLTSLPLVAFEVVTGTVQWPGSKGWALVAFTALIPSFISQIFFMRGVELIGPGRAGIFVNLVPVFAAILAVIILGETFAWHHAVALALVLGGIWLAEQSKPLMSPTETFSPTDGTR